MSKKTYTGNIQGSGTWYKVPSYKVQLVREGETAVNEIVKSPDDMAALFQKYLNGADRENMVAAFLDRKGNLLGINTVSIGGLFSSIVHPREVFKPACIIGAASIIICHNHPSGDTAPSKDDIDITRRLVEAGNIMGIEVIDHVIIGDAGRHCSFKEKGLI